MEQNFRTGTPRPWRETAKGRRGAALAVAAVLALPATAGANPLFWAGEWPNTDFSRHSVDLGEIMSGGPPKDGIPSIDDPKVVPVSDVTVNGEARAYPLGILTQHEIVNDTIGGVPVTVTYCPLCNSSIVFDRRVDGQVLDFGTTGKLRNSDLVMYDRQTESWWQQFSGKAIVGKMTGKTLKMLPSRQESFARFRARAPNGKVLVSNRPFKRYGINPYVGYDSTQFPFLFRGDLPEGIAPMVRVVAVGGEAWSLPLLRRKGTIIQGDLVLSWEAGQNSALDTRVIRRGRDVGNVVVQRRVGTKTEDVVHDVTFAFVFHAFHPEGAIHTD
jgi:hypothetical protein